MKIQLEQQNDFYFHFLGKIERVAIIGIILCAFLVIVYCVWTLDRGFEITDESYYLLLAMHADSVKLFISAQQWLTAILWQVAGSISMFRATGMILVLASSALLAFGVISTCLRFGLVAGHFEDKCVVFAGSVVGAMLYASTINLSPCYNLLASAGAYAGSGMVLLALNRSSMFSKYVFFSLAGCAVGTEALCKASAGAATLAVLIFWCISFGRSWVDKIFSSMVMILGSLTFACIVLLVNTTFSDASLYVEQGMQLFSMVQIETIEERLIRYSKELWEYSLASLKAFAIPFAAMIGYAMTRRTIFSILGITSLVITLIFGSLNMGSPTFALRNATFESYLFGGSNRYDVQTVAIFAMLVILLITTNRVWNKNCHTISLFGGLILLPYTVAIGTGNSLFTQVIDSLAPWGAMVGVMVIARYPNDIGKIVASLIGMFFIVTISLQIVSSGFRPYNLSRPLTKQNQAVIVGNIGKVKVDNDTYTFIKDLKAAAKECDIVPGSPFLGLYNIPGVALALQATPVLTPWLNNVAQADYVIERIRFEEFQSTILALQVGRNGLFPLLPQKLESFPHGYRYCGMATYPYMQQRIQIWRYQAQ